MRGTIFFEEKQLTSSGVFPCVMRR